VIGMNSLFERVRRKLNQRRDGQFVLGLSGSQQSDFGISNTDLQSLVSNPSDTRSRMEAMAKAHGLDPKVLSHDHWREVDMARTCGHCGERRTCSKWLSGKRQELAASSFCPNSHQFSELAKLTD